MSEPLISIIIPNYNHARYLGDAIASALAQSYQHREIIVVDDGSVDDSRQVAARFGSQVTYIYQENSGLSAARNTGLAAARGEYIALLDADDLLETDYLAHLYAAACALPGADGAYCAFRCVDEENRALPQVESRVLAPDALYDALLGGNFWVPESLLARRTCYQAAGPFDVTLRACEDWDMWLRFTAQGRFAGIDAPLIRYRVVTGSMSSDPQRMLVNRLAVLGKHLGPEGTPGTSLAYARAYMRTAVEYLQNGDEEATWRNFDQAARLDPRLLDDLSTYYELVLGRQPRGYRGRCEHLNLAEGEARATHLVARFFAAPDLPAPCVARHGVAQGLLHAAAGMLAYRCGDPARARRNLLRALSFHPALLRNRSFAAQLVNSSLGRSPRNTQAS